MTAVNAFLRTALVFAACVPLAGCSTPRVRASDAMVESNPLGRIAVFGSAQVVWPRAGSLGDKAPYLGPNEGRQALDVNLPMLRTGLEAKGYEVVSCEAAGVGYHAAWLGERLVLDTTIDDGIAQDDPDNYTRKLDEEPLFEYPAIRKDQALRASLRAVFEGLEASHADDEDEDFTPGAADVAVLRTATGADTICLARVSGNVFTGGRKFGTFLLAAALNPGGTSRGAQDDARLECTFVDARTGEVHWAGAGWSQDRPSDDDDSLVEAALSLLPSRGVPLDPKHRLGPED
jgi:hypothetical protein